MTKSSIPPSIEPAIHEGPCSGLPKAECAHEKGFQPTRPVRDSLKRSRQIVKQVLGY